jgi:hypothetical protein
VLKIREDHVLLEQRFYDQDGELVQSMMATDIREMGGRTIAARQRMQQADTPDEWTEMVVDATEYDIEISGNLFTLSNLRNPRD